MRRSPASRCPASSSRTASTAGPALTMTRMRRGRARAATNPSVENDPTSSPSSPCRSSSSRVRLSVRLWTATGKPLPAALRARFAPMVARPVTPSSHCPAIEGPPQPRRALAVQARYRNAASRAPRGRGSAVVDGDGGQLRRLVAVAGLDVGGQGVEAGGGGLDQAEPLVRGLDPPPPAVGGGDRAEHLQ